MSLKSITTRQLDNADREALLCFALPLAQSSMFILSNMERAGLEYNGEAFSGTYLGAYLDGGDDLCGVLAQYWNGNIMVQAPDKTVLHALVTALQNMDNLRPVRGILGPDEQVSAVIAQLDLAEQVFALNESEGLYALATCDLVMPEYGDHIRLAALKDAPRDLVLGWMKAYNIEALGAEDNETFEARIAAEAFSDWAMENRYVLMVDDAPVALAGCNAKVFDLMQIGPVWTPPEYRGKGYARLATALLIDLERTAGKKRAVLFTKNPAAEKAYKAIGFTRSGDFRLALLK